MHNQNQKTLKKTNHQAESNNLFIFFSTYLIFIVLCNYFLMQ